MGNLLNYVLIILFIAVFLGISVFIVLYYYTKQKKEEEKKKEEIKDVREEYEENYRGTGHQDDMNVKTTIIDLMLKYHKNELAKVLNVSNLEDLDYAILVYLNDSMKGSLLERYPFWTVLHKNEASHSLLMLKNALETLPEEEFIRVRDTIFAWLNYVFDLDEDIIQHRDYISKKDMVKIIDDVLNAL